MKNPFPTLAAQTLVLLGGGHSHLAVLMQLAKQPVPGLDIVLVTRDVETPYSGALPAWINGDCATDDLLIDLRPLAQMAGARLIRATVEKMDLQNRTLHCAGRPAIGFDILSINIGSWPDVAAIPGAEQFAIPVKPIPEFLKHWESIQQEVDSAVSEQRPYTITIIGGGPASVELACAMQMRLYRNAGLPLPDRLGQESFIRIVLMTNGSVLLSALNPGAQARALCTLRSRGIDVRLQHSVRSVEQNAVLWETTGTSTVESLQTDRILVATGASAPDWLQHTGLTLDAGGFILVNNHLQSVSHANVFATGDIASIENCPRPRSGVYAVRQGMPLARNLRRFATGIPLQSYNPQAHVLALLNLGDGTAIAARGNWSLQGRWAGVWKKWIDQRFVEKYSRIPAPVERSFSAGSRSSSLRCAGCGAKVGSTMLHDVLAQLHPCTHPDILSAHMSTEDAAMIRIDERRTLLQTVDHFRAFINDPYLFARIATVHCLSDIHAMGATAHSALAIVSVPHAAPRIMQSMLLEIMSGCTEVLNAHNTALIGGHSSEAQELSFGLSVNGFVEPDRILTKRGMQPGDVLILCKPLGTGTLFAADMRYQAKQRWIENALTHMQHSNQMASHCFVRHGANACTDITGFGLLGHLSEMLTPDAVRVVLSLNALPILDGALECVAGGYLSSLQEDNARHAALLTNAEQFHPKQLNKQPLYHLLFDPQTAGGLLASVPARNAAACLADLHAAGYRNAASIGEVLSTGGESAAVGLRE
ncbi:MAG: selenide, water dikinase SelD [Gammaproteobacteria bacterium]|nr:selenide, water dikinase SelD [Gammaproteobacteria bacterium]